MSALLTADITMDDWPYSIMLTHRHSVRHARPWRSASAGFWLSRKVLFSFPRAFFLGLAHARPFQEALRGTDVLAIENESGEV